jgi:hypothetical protein
MDAHSREERAPPIGANPPRVIRVPSRSFAVPLSSRGGDRRHFREQTRATGRFHGPRSTSVVAHGAPSWPASLAPPSPHFLVGGYREALLFASLTGDKPRSGQRFKPTRSDPRIVLGSAPVQTNPIRFLRLAGGRAGGPQPAAPGQCLTVRSLRQDAFASAGSKIPRCGADLLFSCTHVWHKMIPLQ